MNTCPAYLSISLSVCVCVYLWVVKMERKIREVWGERIKNRVRRTFVHSTSGSPWCPGKPDLYASHIPVSQLSPCGYIHLRL